MSRNCEKDFMKHRDQVLVAIHATHGLPARIARELGVTRAAVCSWKRIPLRHLKEVSRITGIAKSQLRPDIFADEPEIAA